MCMSVVHVLPGGSKHTWDIKGYLPGLQATCRNLPLQYVLLRFKHSLTFSSVPVQLMSWPKGLEPSAASPSNPLAKLRENMTAFTIQVQRAPSSLIYKELPAYVTQFDMVLSCVTWVCDVTNDMRVYYTVYKPYRWYHTLSKRGVARKKYASIGDSHYSFLNVQ